MLYTNSMIVHNMKYTHFYKVIIIIVDKLIIYLIHTLFSLQYAIKCYH